MARPSAVSRHPYASGHRSPGISRRVVEVFRGNQSHKFAPVKMRPRLTLQWQVNAKGTMVTVQAFLRTAPTSGASIIGISSGSVTAPAQAEAGQSAYSASKIASVKVLEHVAMEHPHIFVANVHPGVVKTGMYETAQAEARGLPVDTGGSCRNGHTKRNID